jgi:hypothetical protein
MSKLGLLFSFLFSAISFGQITLESTDYLQSGDTARLSQATDPGIDFYSTGINSVWDFSYLQAETQTLFDPLLVANAGFLIQMRFGNFAPAEYMSDYYSSFSGLPFDQFGSFLPVNIEDVFRFTKISQDSISYTGYSMLVDSNEVPFQSDTIEVPMKFPMSFGDAYNGRAYSKVDFNPIFNGIFIQYRQRETVVDGYGSLITPYGSFNTIRVKHTVQELDSLYADLFGFATWIPLQLPTQNIYEWWAKDELVPVMKIETQFINGDEVVSLVEYKDTYLGLTNSIISTEINFELYPNPSNDELFIEANTAIQSIALYSADGKRILEEMGYSASQLRIDTSTIEGGNYLILVTTAAGQKMERIIIQH